jgi:hypothetical protein
MPAGLNPSDFEDARRPSIPRSGTLHGRRHFPRREIPMPRYFISTTIKGRTHEHEEPLEVADDHAAWTEATTACGEIMKEMDGDFSAPGEWRIDVKDEARRPLYSLRVIAEVHGGTPR